MKASYDKIAQQKGLTLAAAQAEYKAQMREPRIEVMRQLLNQQQPIIGAAARLHA